MSSPRSPGKSTKASASRTPTNDIYSSKGETAAAASSFAGREAAPTGNSDYTSSDGFDEPSIQNLAPRSSFEPGKSDTKRDPLEAVTSVTSDFTQAAQMATEAIKKQASDLTANIGSELSNTAEQQKRQGAQAIQGFAHAIDTAASELDTQSPLVARYIHDAARQIETFGSNLSNRNVNELMVAVTNLARRRPALFLGGAVATGMVLARFLKSSARNQPTTEA